MQYDCHVTMEMQQTHCHATVPVALLWKCYKDLTCHNIVTLLELLIGNSPKQEQNLNIFTVCLNQADIVHNFAGYFLFIYSFGVDLSRFEH
jgi:hypothetical protein